jgi:hypothetical protein
MPLQSTPSAVPLGCSRELFNCRTNWAALIETRQLERVLADIDSD